MIKKLSGAFFIFSLLILAGSGCSNLPNFQATPTSSSPTQVSPTPTPQPTQASPDGPTVINLNIWLPPEFAPNQDSPASILLQERLNEFNDLYPNLNVTYRIKAESGAASLLESVRTTSKVAPLALPELVLISHAEMHTATANDLIYPFPVTLTPEEDPDWYPVAYTLSRYQEQTFFLPFAADALAAVYNPNLLETFPASWGDLLLAEQSIAFPPSDPQAYNTIALYSAEGGRFLDEEENIHLEEGPLIQVLDFYANLHAANLLLANPAQIDSDDSAWNQFALGNAAIVITRISRYFAARASTYQVAALPTSDGNPFTMINSWGWSITTPDPNEQAAAAELARFLSDPEFTGPWTEAAQLLPLRPSAVSLWTNSQYQNIAQHLLPAARPAPPPEVFSAISTPLTEAVLDVLTDVQTPADAASAAVYTVGN